MPHPVEFKSVFPVLLAAAVGFGLLSTGCSPRQLMVNSFVEVAETGMPAFEQEDDLTLLAQAMPSHIKILETILASDPDNPRLLTLLSQLYAAYAFSVLETQWERQHFFPENTVGMDSLQPLEEHLQRCLEKGVDYALQALEARHPGAAEQFERPRQADGFLRSLGEPDVPALFWYGFNLGLFVQHNLDSVAAMGRSYLVEKTMQRVIELNPGYYHGSAQVVMMVYYASRPPMMGGNPKLAAEHYHLHKEQWPDVTGMREMYWARYYLVQQQDRDGFTHILKSLISTSVPDNHPLGLLEHVAAVRAEIYLEAADQLFEE